jgi:hypothetical protein
MHFIKPILILAFGILLFSCDRVKRKGRQLSDKASKEIDQAKQKISDKKDKLFPAYDSGKPDTESNRKRFKEHLQVAVSEDVKDIYTYGDFLGVDYKVLIAFTCDTSTIARIVQAQGLELSQQDMDTGLFFLDELPWWDKKIIENIRPYKQGKEYEYWKYLWYDVKNKKAYYEEFSL